MIDFSVKPNRKKRLLALADIVQPEQMVAEILCMEGRLVLPVRHAFAMYDWLRTGHAVLGPGFHDILWGAEHFLDKALYTMRIHPAMKGYGMLGRRNQLPLSCWMHDFNDGIPLCNIDGAGVEGFLVPEDARFDGSKDHYTFWTFVQMPHGGPRLKSSLFVPAFGNGNQHEKDAFAAKKAAERRSKFGN